MVTSQPPDNPRRRRLGDRAPTGEPAPDGDPTPDNPHDSTSGHPNAPGTLPMACHPPDSKRRTTARVKPRPGKPARPDDEAPSPATGQGGAAPDDVKALMRARLAAMPTPRDTDTPELAALRAVLRDERLMAHVTANVDRWPPLTDEQRETLAALLHWSRRRT